MSEQLALRVLSIEVFESHRRRPSVIDLSALPAPIAKRVEEKITLASRFPTTCTLMGVEL